METIVLERILVPLDGEPLSERILTEVRRILVRRDAKVRLLRVLPGSGKGRMGDPEVAQAAWDHVQELRNRLRDEGADVECDLVAGESPARRIVEDAERFRPSLIAMATHGHAGVQRMLEGSVAEAVLRRTSCPLLVSNPLGLAPEMPPRELPIRRILVPLDGTERSERILPAAAAMARLYGSELLLFRVREGTSPVSGPFAEAGLGDAREIAAVQRLCGEIAESGVKVRAEAAEGSPIQGILRAAIERDADLIALGTHGRTGLARLAFGSVAEGVVRRSPYPVLVQRTADVRSMRKAREPSRSAKGPA